MANQNPTITQEFIDNQRKAIGLSEKTGSKVFGLRLPLDYEKRLNSLPQKDRVILMRSAVMNAIDNLNE